MRNIPIPSAMSIQSEITKSDQSVFSPLLYESLSISIGSDFHTSAVHAPEIKFQPLSFFHAAMASWTRHECFFNRIGSV